MGRDTAMTIVTSNLIRFNSGVPFENPPASLLVGSRKVFTGTQYYYGGKLDEPPPAILAYSGCAYDTDTGKIFLFGGGHHDYSGNEVWEFCVDRPQDRWTRHYAPSTYQDKAAVMADLDNTNRPGTYVSTQRPISRHTYYSLTWATNVGRMYAGGGSTWDGPDGSFWSIYPNAPGDLWAYDPGSKKWKYCGSSLVDRQWPVVSAIVHHPERGTILTLSGKRTSAYDPKVVSYSYVETALTVWEFNPLANNWTNHGVALPGNWEYWLIALDHSRDQLVLAAWNNARVMYLFTYDIAVKTWTQRVTKGSAPPLPFGTYVREGDRMVYSTLSGRLLYVSATNDGALYALDTNTWTWTQVLPFGAFPQINQAFATTWCPQRNEMYLTYKLGRLHSVNIVGVQA
jgi:hypothetical protein